MGGNAEYFVRQRGIRQAEYFLRRGIVRDTRTLEAFECKEDSQRGGGDV